MAISFYGCQHLTPIYSPGGQPPGRAASLGRAVGQQIRAYRTGLPLLAPLGGVKVKDMPLNYRIWGMQYARQEAQVLTSYPAIADLFQSDGVDGRLLILGEPGMGKTHTLLAVAEILWQRASRNSGPIPVLVNLAAWAGEALEPWLTAYLWEEYRVCQATATTWLQTAQLTLLLDEFDALSSDRQRQFTKGLDILLRSNANQTAILCCRRQVLEAGGITFSYFNSGVHILPLAAQQVKTYVLAKLRCSLAPH
ncbi:MAG: NACHT domain-containing protein [Leptolyngbyaceae cyanobacterium SM2_5_2]|nr:NACHT domain-containing protein [Leptolyngbyaceae cyanobacterium SM2_5_2]